MMQNAMPTRGAMPGRVMRRASIFGKPERRGSMTGGKGKGPLLSLFQASETRDEPEETTTTALVPSPVQLPPRSTPAPVMAAVQITGLELLKQNSKSTEDEEDDFSYDSYAQDSVVLMCTKVRKVGEGRPLNARFTQSEHISKRRLSPVSNTDDDDDLDSMARDYYDYGPSCRPPTAEKKLNARRNSIESYGDDSLGFDRYRSTRRSSLGTIGSYANDSFECRNVRAPRYQNSGSALGASLHGNRYGRRGSLGSQYGRRGSIESQMSMDSNNGGGRRAGRRGSLGSQASMGSNNGGGRYTCRVTTRRHSSHCGTLETMRKSLDGPIGPFTRRSSLGSCSSGVSIGVASTSSTRMSRAA